MDFVLVAAVTFFGFLSVLNFVLYVGMGKRLDAQNTAIIDMSKGCKKHIEFSRAIDAKATQAINTVMKFYEGVN